jgi:hypothetical protein
VIVDILQQTPVWVWALLMGLLALGLLQTRIRELSVARVTAVPAAMVLLSLGGILSAFGLLAMSLAAWAAGFGIASYGWLGATKVPGASWSPISGTLRVPGSWLPLVMIVGLFLTRYAAAVFLSLNPQWASDGVFAGTCSLAYGVFSGMFWGRARSLRALAMSDVQAQPA